MFKSIKRLVGRAAKQVAGENDDKLVTLEADNRRLWDELGALQASLEAAEDKLKASQDEIVRAHRIGTEYFQAIEDMHGEREQWKDMFYTQAIQHQGAQAMLSRALYVARKQLQLTAKELLKHDEDGAKALFERLDALLAPPIGAPQKFADAMLELAKSAGPQTDGLGERARIAQDAAAPAVAEQVDVRSAEELYTSNERATLCRPSDDSLDHGNGKD